DPRPAAHGKKKRKTPPKEKKPPPATTPPPPPRPAGIKKPFRPVRRSQPRNLAIRPRKRGQRPGVRGRTAQELAAVRWLWACDEDWLRILYQSSSQAKARGAHLLDGGQGQGDGRAQPAPGVLS